MNQNLKWNKLYFKETQNKDLKKVLIQNNNSIVWNLLWRFVSKPKELDKDFKNNCLKELREAQLYPIKDPLKSRFQNFSTVLLNQEWLLKLYIQLRN